MSHPNKININPAASVVEIGLARQLLYLVGYGVTREEDNLVIYPETETYSLYIEPTQTNQKTVGRLFVNEGNFSSCLYSNHLGIRNNPWDELVDFQSLLWYLLRKINPEYIPEPSPFHGRGRTQCHTIDQHIKEFRRLQTAKTIYKTPDYGNIFNLLTFVTKERTL